MGFISHMPREWPAVAGYRPGSAVDQGGIVGESQGRPRTAQFRVARVLTPGRPVPGYGLGFGMNLGAVASPVLGGLLNAIRPAALRPHSACASSFPLHADTDTSLRGDASIGRRLRNCRRPELQMCAYHRSAAATHRGAREVRPLPGCRTGRVREIPSWRQSFFFLLRVISFFSGSGRAW